MLICIKEIVMRALIESKKFSNLVIAVIVINGSVLGLQTYHELPSIVLKYLSLIDSFCLVFFVVELAVKLTVYRGQFFRESWNIFDFAVVFVALIPAAGPLSILRAFRILRVLRLVSSVQSFRRVVASLFIALPGAGAVSGILAIIFYVSSVISTSLFGAAFPEWFGTLGSSMYSLFQIMTLESWSMGIVRPVMVVYPNAWIFFISFITITSFTVLNLFIGIIVDAIETVKEQETNSLKREEESQAIVSELQKDLEAAHKKLDQIIIQTLKSR
jgi:voltage-gated sodium channel